MAENDRQNATIQVAIDKIVISPNRRPIRDLGALCTSIKELGLLNAITITPDFQLIAGYHRIEACKRLGWTEIRATICHLEGLRIELAEIDENLARNELNELERGEQLARRKEIYEALYPTTKAGIAGALSKHGSNSANAMLSFADNTASQTNQSPRTIQRSVKIGTDIPPEVRDMIRETSVADNQHALLTLASMPEPEQRKVAEKLAAGEARDIKAAKQQIKHEELTDLSEQYASTADYKVVLSDIRALRIHVEPESIDAIITDPPYNRAAIETYRYLAEFAAYALRPGGSLLAMAGQSYLPDVYQALSALTYHWTIGYITPGGQSPQIWERKVNTFWKPVLWYVKGEYTGSWIGDVVTTPANANDKRFHYWGQNEIGTGALVEMVTKPGDLVADPFLGGGTTGVVALDLKRRFLGSDVDETAIKLAKGRLLEALRVTTS